MVWEMGIMSSKPRWKVAQVATVLPALALLASCMRQTEQKTAETAESKPAASRGNVLKPYKGPSVSGVDTSTLNGKIMCGYQGWFNCKGDGSGLGWFHWARDRKKTFGPGNVTVDFWPDISELGPDERYATRFRHADGRVSKVFSSANRKTVLRHFEWMRDYGIDGAFIQRFAHGLVDRASKRHKDIVLANAREGANRAGRAYAVMYDLTGLKRGDVDLVRRDWLALRKTMRITKDPAYLHHRDKPVVVIWGVGFRNRRAYSLAECRDLIEWLKADECTVMLGVPSAWREGIRDATDDPMRLELMKSADILSPWTVGRYRTPAKAATHGEKMWKPDRVWCERRKIDYLPVVFPGFSRHNLKRGKLDAIPRLNGKFLWTQMVAAKRAGCKMIYVAMFDEVDEGTAIFKCTNDPPVGEGVRFLTYKGLPSDYYLRVVGEGGRMLRDEIPPTDTMPEINHDLEVDHKRPDSAGKLGRN